MNLPRGLVNLLVEHRGRQEEEREVVDELWTDTGFIFTTNFGTAVNPRNLNRDFAIICQRAGLDHWHPHDYADLRVMPTPIHNSSSVMVNDLKWSA